MLDAAMWQAHSLKLPERIKLARLCLQNIKSMYRQNDRGITFQIPIYKP